MMLENGKVIIGFFETMPFSCLMGMLGNDTLGKFGQRREKWISRQIQ
jgi:hypothetical protein